MTVFEPPRYTSRRAAAGRYDAADRGVRRNHHVPPDGAVLPRELLDHLQDSLFIDLGATHRCGHRHAEDTGVAERLEQRARHVALLFTGVAPLRNDRGQGPRPLDPLTCLDRRVCRHGRCSFLPVCTPARARFLQSSGTLLLTRPCLLSIKGHSARKISLTVQSACSTPLGSTSGTHARNASLSARHWHYFTSATCAAHTHDTRLGMLYFALLQPKNGQGQGGRAKKRGGSGAKGTRDGGGRDEEARGRGEAAEGGAGQERREARAEGGGGGGGTGGGAKGGGGRWGGGRGERETRAALRRQDQTLAFSCCRKRERKRTLEGSQLQGIVRLVTPLDSWATGKVLPDLLPRPHSLGRYAMRRATVEGP